MNPAVTLAFAFVRRLKWIKVPVYCIAQLFGAFLASAVVYGIYYGRTLHILVFISGMLTCRTFLWPSFSLMRTLKQVR